MFIIISKAHTLFPTHAFAESGDSLPIYQSFFLPGLIGSKSFLAKFSGMVSFLAFEIIQQRFCILGQHVIGMLKTFRAAIVGVGHIKDMTRTLKLAHHQNL